MASTEELLDLLIKALGRGEENAQHIPKIARAIGLEGDAGAHQVRRLAKQLIMHRGIAVCAGPMGMYLPRYAEDLKPTLEDLRKREDGVRTRRLVLERLATDLPRKGTPPDPEDWVQGDLL